VEHLTAEVARSTPVASSHALDDTKDIGMAARAMCHAFVVIPSPRRMCVDMAGVWASDVLSRMGWVPLDAERSKDFPLTASDDMVDIVGFSMRTI
jgi:hypothetical protein